MTTPSGSVSAKRMQRAPWEPGVDGDLVDGAVLWWSTRAGAGFESALRISDPRHAVPDHAADPSASRGY